MFKKLLIVFASATVLSIVSLTGAWMAGGADFRRTVWQDGNWEWNIGEDDEDLGPLETRSFAVESGSRIAMEIPVELSFTRSDQAGMTVKGPAKLLERLVWKDGRLTLKGKSNRWRHNLKVTITAPEIQSLDLEAPGDVKMVGLDQDQLTVGANGALQLDAEGKVRKITVTSNGAGDIDLRKVTGEEVRVEINGAGDVVMGPSRIADIELNGAGQVTLVRKPEVLRSQINGAGSIKHNYADKPHAARRTAM